MTDDRLHRLLRDIFSPAELRRFLSTLPSGDELVAALPVEGATTDDLVSTAIAVLRRHGLLGAELFLRLLDLRPRRAAELRALARAYEIDLPPPEEPLALPRPPLERSTAARPTTGPDLHDDRQHLGPSPSCPAPPALATAARTHRARQSIAWSLIAGGLVAAIVAVLVRGLQSPAESTLQGDDTAAGHTIHTTVLTPETPPVETPPTQPSPVPEVVQPPSSPVPEVVQPPSSPGTPAANRSTPARDEPGRSQRSSARNARVVRVLTLRCASPEIRRCFTLHQLGEKHVDVNFFIDPETGKARPEFPPLLRGSALTRCLSREIEAWQLPTTRGRSDTIEASCRLNAGPADAT